MSLKFFLNTCWQNLSFSTNAIVSKYPVLSKPRLNPPIPENKSNNFNFIFVLQFDLKLLSKDLDYNLIYCNL